MYVWKKKKRHCPSVKRLKLERDRRVEQSDKDYARAHTMFLTGDAHTKNRNMKRKKSVRTTSFHLLLLFFTLSSFMCVYGMSMFE